MQADLNVAGCTSKDKFKENASNLMFWLNFSIPELRDQIVLSPQFLVNSLKSLITAEAFCKKKPEIRRKWSEFRQKGILRRSLLGMLTLSMLGKILFCQENRI